MTFNLLKDYITFTDWANTKVIAWLEQITQEQFEQNLVSSFPSVATTVQHIISAEHIWLQRLEGHPTEWLQNTMSVNKEAIITTWQRVISNWNVYAKELTQEKANSSITFTTLNGKESTMSVGNVIMHCCNHSTQHRGQLITMLRQVCFTDVSSVDMLSYYRSKV